MFSRKRDPLYPYERAILEAVVGAAPPSVGSTLRAQVHQIRHVQRSSASPEIHFYASRTGGGWSQTWLLPDPAELRLAEFGIRLGGQRHTGTVDAVSGHLFSLVVRPKVDRPKHAVPEDIQVSVAYEGSVGVALEVAPDSFLNGGRELSDEAAESWALLDPAEAYVVSLPDADWAVLAQGPQGRLLLGRRSHVGEAFCVANVEDDSVGPLVASSTGSALREAEKGAS